VAEPATGLLHIASAGHFPPVIAAPGGTPVLADIAVGVPIGVADDPPRLTTTLRLAAGTVLCQFTDGLVERRGVLIDDRLAFLCRTVTPAAPESVCISVMRALVGREPIGDDVALLVLRWHSGRDQG
jgi:serine phosphatase RsbU (regulator of sigma subunit)